MIKERCFNDCACSLLPDNICHTGVMWCQWLWMSPILQGDHLELNWYCTLIYFLTWALGMYTISISQWICMVDMDTGPYYEHFWWPKIWPYSYSWSIVVEGMVRDCLISSRSVIMISMKQITLTFWCQSFTVTIQTIVQTWYGFGISCTILWARFFVQSTVILLWLYL